MRLDSGSSAYTGALWGSGTSFPTGPTTNQRFTRTDRGLDYYYDGTRWLTTTLYREHGLGGTTSATTNNQDRMTPHYTDYDLYFVDLLASTYVASGNTGSAYWTVDFFKIDPSNVATNIGSISTGATPDSNATWTPHKTAINAQIAPASFPEFRWDITKVSTPGNVSFSIAVTYRLVG